MVSILTLLLVVTLSIILTRIATVALTHTGLSRESARFQARSAFTGVGFTTSEAEGVVNHPVRRRIVLLLMLLGNAGIVTAVSSLIIAFVGEGSTGAGAASGGVEEETGGGSSLALKVVLLVGGVVLLWTISASQWVDRHLSRLIDWALHRYTELEVKDYASLMHLVGEYRIVELEVEEGDWIADRTLADLGLREEGVVVLGIKRRKGTYLGAPKGHTEIFAGDVLILYGRIAALEEIDRRGKDWRGDREHREAIEEQEKVREEEEKLDPGGDEGEKKKD